MSAESPSPEVGAIFNRAELGLRRYEEGKDFEERVAELFRLQGYDVEHGRLFAGRQIDLFISRRLGDYVIQRVIECKAGRVRAEDMDSFHAKLQGVRAEYPRADGTIISGDSFTDAITAQAHTLGIQLTLFRELSANLFDGNKYAHWLIRECESNSRYPMSLYIEHFVGYEPTGSYLPAPQIVREWLDDNQWNQFTLLGDVGTGKSFLSRVVAYQLAKDFQRRPLENPLPILIDLRNADRQFSLEGLLLTHLARCGLSDVSFDAFQYAVAQGRVVLILDGFDEMAALVTPQVTLRNFHELARSVHGRAKVLLTCRTHYFKSRTEEEEVILGRTGAYDSDEARELYWDLISRKGFKIGYLRAFDRSQIERYVKQVKGPEAPAALEKIRRTYNLMELSQRPMLLEMIVRSLDKLTATQINAATLYQVYTDAWIHRDQWREVLTPAAKVALVTAIARSLWDQDRTSIHHTSLEACLRSELSSRIQDPREFLEIDHEVRTASFLTRDEAGNYGFAHKSYSEYFVARYVAGELNDGNIDCLNGRRLSPEIISFLSNMVDLDLVEGILTRVLQGDYRSLISENALVCLYGFRRSRAVEARSSESESSSAAFVVRLPDDVRLSGAQLPQILLEGAVLRRACFDRANISQGVLIGCDLSGASMDSAILDGASLIEANLSHTNFASSSAKAANFDGANLERADFAQADLSDAYLLGANCSDIILTGTKLLHTLLPEALEGAVAVFWRKIEELRPWMLSTVRAFDYYSKDMDPEDVVSEVALRLVRPKYFTLLVGQEEAVWKRVLGVVIRRVVRENWEQTRRYVPLDSKDGFWESQVADSGRGADNSLLDEIDPDQLMNHLAAVLSPLTMNILHLRTQSGWSLKKIAESLNMSQSTVQRHIRKARERAVEYRTSLR